AAVVSAPGTISGNTTACVGTATTLIDGGGGTWTSNATAIATIGLNTGIVSGLVTGTATITYSLGTGCTATTVVTVSPAPGAISGLNTVCPGAAISLSHAVTGGTWSSGNTGVATVDASGNVTGVAPVTTSITYTLPNGCPTAKTITVNPLPLAITGNTDVCL